MTGCLRGARITAPSGVERAWLVFRARGVLPAPLTVVALGRSLVVLAFLGLLLALALLGLLVALAGRRLLVALALALAGRGVLVTLSGPDPFVRVVRRPGRRLARGWHGLPAVRGDLARAARGLDQAAEGDDLLRGSAVRSGTQVSDA